MTPILSLVLASVLSSPEPTRDHVQLLAAIELHATIETRTVSEAAQAAADPAFWYDARTSARLDARPRPGVLRITYTLASPVFRDLL
jgi:hypothetical protein